MAGHTSARTSILLLKADSSLDEVISAAAASLSSSSSSTSVDVREARSLIENAAANAAAAGSPTPPSSSAAAAAPSYKITNSSSTPSSPPLGSSSSSSPSSLSSSSASPSSSSSALCYDAIVACGAPAVSVDLFSFAKILFGLAKSDASFLLFQNCGSGGSRENGESDASAALRKFRRLLSYSGFVTAAEDDMPEVLRPLVSKGKFANAFSLQWCGKKPTWEIGAFQVVSSGGKTTADTSGGTTTSGEDAELIDETALIEEQDAYIPLGKDRSSCASRPKACPNCTCGRKEQEEAQEREARRKMLESGEVRSSCGSCYLGDAFRCAGCPYRGLPAFKPGEKVSLLPETSVDPARPTEKPVTTVAMTKVQLTNLTDDL